MQEAGTSAPRQPSFREVLEAATTHVETEYGHSARAERDHALKTENDRLLLQRYRLGDALAHLVRDSGFHQAFLRVLPGDMRNDDVKGPYRRYWSHQRGLTLAANNRGASLVLRSNGNHSKEMLLTIEVPDSEVKAAADQRNFGFDRRYSDSRWERTLEGKLVRVVDPRDEGLLKSFPWLTETELSTRIASWAKGTSRADLK
jgi:hypothetical protein